MSKVNAYRCNYCGQIKEEKSITGILPTEDLFDKLNGYPITNKLDKTEVHFCTDCYNAAVLRVAAVAIDRKRFEDLYKEKLKELSYSFKYQTVYNFRNKIFCKVLD